MIELACSPAVCIWWTLSLLSRPVTWTLSRLKSARPSSLIPAAPLRPYRCFAARLPVPSLAWFLLSMEFWQPFMTSM